MPVRPFVLLGAVVVAGGVLAMQQLGIGPFGQRQNLFSQNASANSDQPAADQAALRTSAVSSPSAQQQASPAPLSTSQFDTRTAQADTAPSAASPAPAAQPAVRTGPAVDETALRYFAARGDSVRLEAEIARLKALYPTWTPPADPLAAAATPQGDPQLDQMWKLYSENKIADVRKAISDRQTREPEWQVPADLLERLALAEAREQLVNASDIKQYDTVIRVASSNPAMLTCGDVDVLWRVAEAFALTDRKPRSIDAYLYVLNTCEKPEERLATIQKAMVVLSRPELERLLAAEKTTEGKPEFEPVRGEIARRAVVEADADPTVTVAPAELALVEKLANEGGLQSDDLMLGWYYLRRENPALALTWFGKAYTKQNDAASAQGLALSLINLDRPQEAENILYQWRDTSDEVRAVYMAAVANMLAIQPPPAFPPEVLARAVAEIAKTKDAASAQQLGWYADSFNQFETAARWFRTALEWKADDEPSAYGLALMAWKLGDRASMQAVQTAWAGRSERIPTVGEPSIQTAALEASKRRQVEIGYAADPNAPRPIQSISVTSGAQMPMQRQPVAAQPGYPQPAPQQPVYQQTPQQAYQQPAYPQPVQQPQYQQPTYQQPTYQQPVQQAPVYQQPTYQQPPVYQQPAQQQPIYQQPAQPYSQNQQPYYPPVAQQQVEMPRQAAAASYTTEQPQVVRSQPRRSSGKSDRVRPSGCRSTMDPEGLSPQAALTRGWCLMEANRPIEAAKAFEVALRGNGQTKSDAAYGQSLAYMRVGMTDSAAVAATKAPFSNSRAVEVNSAMLAARANSAFQNKRYTETLLALDERARISPEQTGLMILRGYAYLSLKRFGDAERVFRAAAAAGSKDARRGLNDLWAERNPASSPY